MAVAITTLPAKRVPPTVFISPPGVRSIRSAARAIRPQRIRRMVVAIENRWERTLRARFDGTSLAMARLPECVSLSRVTKSGATQPDPTTVRHRASDFRRPVGAACRIPGDFFKEDL